MKNAVFKKRIPLFLCLLTAAVLAGCGKREAGTAPSKDYVYRCEELPLSADMPEAYTILQAGDSKFVLGYEWVENSDSSWLIIGELDENGAVISQSRVEQPGGTSYNTLTGSEVGDLFGSKFIYQESGSGEEIVYSEEYYLVRLGVNGKEVWSVPLNDIPELNDQEYFYVSTVTSLPGEKLLVYAMGKYAFFDTDGNYEGILKLSGPGAEAFQNDAGSMVVLADGRLLNYRYGETGLVFQEVNYETGALSEEITLEGRSYSYSIFAGSDYDLLLVDSNDIYGYNLGKEPVKLMNFIDSDVNTYGIGSLLSISPGLFWGQIYDVMEDRSYLASFTKVDPRDVVDKTNITLAGNYIDWEVKKQVITFNKSNEKYRINLLDYGALYNTDMDYTAGLAKLNADIASGNIPDILMITYDLPVKSYMAKGLFQDLIPMIEQDEELEVQDLLPNVVKAYSMDGHLYQMVPAFYVNTVFAKASSVGDELGWTIEEATSWLESCPPGTELFDNMVREQILRYSMTMGGEQFIDWQNGTCSYGSDAFIELLEFAKSFPEEQDSSRYEDPNYGESWESAFREGRILTYVNLIDSFRGYNRTRRGMFGEAITPIGFPTESGIGSSLDSYMSLAISARSKQKEAAWEFVRYFWTDEYQTKVEYMFPVSVRAFDEAGEKALKKQTYTDEMGKVVEVDDYYYTGQQDIVLEPISAEDLQKVKDFIYMVDTDGENNEDLYNIIMEEAAPFFAGQKSAQEVADIIQSRAHIYVSENL